MSTEDQNNIIPFPSLRNRDQISHQNEVHNKESKESNQLYWLDQKKKKNTLSSSGEKEPFYLNMNKKSELSGNKEKSANMINRTNVEFWHNSDSSDQRPRNPDSNEKGGKDEGEQNRKKFNSIGISTACVLCLLLAGVPFLNQRTAQKQRGLASQDSLIPVVIVKDGERYTASLYENENRNLTVRLVPKEDGGGKKSRELYTDKEKNKLMKMIRKQEKTAVHLIQSGKRKITSVGQAPTVKNLFSMEALKSRYQVRWRRGKLVYAELLYNKQPVSLPDMHKVFKKYHSLFPSYKSVEKMDSLSGNKSVYELKDRRGFSTARVEVEKNEEGGLLSIRTL